MRANSLKETNKVEEHTLLERKNIRVNSKRDISGVKEQ